MKPVKAARPSRAPRGPFAHPFDVRSLHGEARRVVVKATGAQCEAAALAVGLPAIGRLEGAFRLVPRAGGRVDIDGTVTALVTQTCVVTLDAFESVVEQDVDVSFAPATEPLLDMRSKAGGRGLGNAPVDAAPSVGGNDDQEDPPDLIVDDMIDLGALALEFMVLGLDPHPRKPGVHFDDMVVGEKEPPAAFAALARLKDRP